MREIFGINFEGQDVRTVLYEGVVYFGAADICALYLMETPGNVHSKVAEEHKIYVQIDDVTGSQKRKMVMVNKYGALHMVYRFNSKKHRYQDPHAVAEFLLGTDAAILSDELRRTSQA